MKSQLMMMRTWMHKLNLLDVLDDGSGLKSAQQRKRDKIS